MLGGGVVAWGLEHICIYVHIYTNIHIFTYMKHVNHRIPSHPLPPLPTVRSSRRRSLGSQQMGCASRGPPFQPWWIKRLSHSSTPGRGSKLSHQGPQVAVHVSIYQGNPFWVHIVDPQPPQNAAKNPAKGPNSSHFPSGWPRQSPNCFFNLPLRWSSQKVSSSETQEVSYGNDSPEIPSPPLMKASQ